MTYTLFPSLELLVCVCLSIYSHLLCSWFQVTGDTVYNMLRLAEVECDNNERPLNPHKIRSTEVCLLHA